MKQIVAIAACDSRMGIGRNETIPWYIKEDLQYFRKTTLGQTVVMGRATWDSLGGIPLVDRDNWVLSRTMQASENSGYRVFKSVEEVLRNVKDNERLFVIGGAQTYAAFSGLYTAIHLTCVPGDTGCDVWLPLSLMLLGDPWNRPKTTVKRTRPETDYIGIDKCTGTVAYPRVIYTRD